jgi:hypothetical protein
MLAFANAAKMHQDADARGFVDGVVVAEPVNDEAPVLVNDVAVSEPIVVEQSIAVSEPIAVEESVVQNPFSLDHTGYDQLRTEFDYTHGDIEGANQTIADWYVDVVKPKLDDHRDFVTRWALGMAEEANGELLDTCEAGTVCRNAVEAETKGFVAEEWRKLMQNFKSDVEGAILKTEEFVNLGWQDAVQCEIDHPCCEYNAVEWANMQKRLEAHVTMIIKKTEQISEIERRINEMEAECIEYNLPWEEYRAAAAMMDLEAAAAGVEVEDQMTLDDTIEAEMAHADEDNWRNTDFDYTE